MKCDNCGAQTSIKVYGKDGKLSCPSCYAPDALRSALLHTRGVNRCAPKMTHAEKQRIVTLKRKGSVLVPDPRWRSHGDPRG